MALVSRFIIFPIPDSLYDARVDEGHTIPALKLLEFNESDDVMKTIGKRLVFKHYVGFKARDPKPDGSFATMKIVGTLKDVLNKARSIRAVGFTTHRSANPHEINTFIVILAKPYPIVSVKNTSDHALTSKTIDPWSQSWILTLTPFVKQTQLS